ncbi:MAG: hypothetical protein HOV79_17540 [Hamadaea sp.]|nr:hypothetical protein [Hamadaea sp.]
MNKTAIAGLGILMLTALTACGPAQTPGGTGSTTSTATTAPATTAPKDGPATIPLSAYLQKADTKSPDDPNVVTEAALPPFCGASYPSSSQRRVAETRYMRYYTKPPTGQTPDGTIRQTIATFTGDGGTRFVAEIKAAAKGCPEEKISRTVYKNKLLTPQPHGDETLLIERTYPVLDVDDKPTGGTEVRLIAVVRIGNVVTVLYETGWERGWSAEPATMQALTIAAEQRLRAWLG